MMNLTFSMKWVLASLLRRKSVVVALLISIWSLRSMKRKSVGWERLREKDLYSTIYMHMYRNVYDSHNIIRQYYQVVLLFAHPVAFLPQRCKVFEKREKQNLFWTPWLRSESLGSYCCIRLENEEAVSSLSTKICRFHSPVFGFSGELVVTLVVTARGRHEVAETWNHRTSTHTNSSWSPPSGVQVQGQGQPAVVELIYPNLLKEGFGDFPKIKEPVCLRIHPGFRPTCARFVFLHYLLESFFSRDEMRAGH